MTHPVVWQDVGFELTDTGGMFGASEDPLHELVLERGQRALDQRGSHRLRRRRPRRAGARRRGDRQAARAARTCRRSSRSTRPTTAGREPARSEFYRLGFDPVVEISAEHGEGVGDLLDEIVERLPRRSARSREPTTMRSRGRRAAAHGTAERRTDEIGVAIVGRPNAGKSSLVNRLLREERMIVSEMPGTTRDSGGLACCTWHRRQFRIVDTAGIRRPGKVAEADRSRASACCWRSRAIERADVVVLVVDATAGADRSGRGDCRRGGQGGARRRSSPPTSGT